MRTGSLCGMLAPMASGHVGVILEVGAKRVFASAVDWPGWCRSARDEELALEALTAYRSRYAVVARRAGVPFRPGRAYDVVDRVPGNGTTDFGAPGVESGRDLEPLTAAAARRQVALLRAAWEELDRVGAEAPETLRKGPRGGGRDRDAVVAHVLGSERSYARLVGVRHPEPALGDAAAIETIRADLSAALTTPSPGDHAAVVRAPAVGRRWPPRYALRRITWHVLDHVWEIEDRSET